MGSFLQSIFRKKGGIDRDINIIETEGEKTNDRSKDKSCDVELTGMAWQPCSLDEVPSNSSIIMKESSRLSKSFLKSVEKPVDCFMS